MFNLKKKNFSKVDILLLASAALLIIIGLLTLYSATRSIDLSIRSQVLASLLGLCFIGFLMLVDYDFIKGISKYFYLLGLILLVLLIFFGTGREDWGSDNWLVLGPFSIQPAEFVKVFLIVSLAKVIEDNINKLNQPLTLIKVLAFALLPIVLILKEDFGTAMATMGIVVAMLFAAGLSYKYIGLGIGLAAASVPLAYPFLDDYQKNRILNFLNPSRDISGSGLQGLQGKIAIGSGMLTGRGYLQGVQTQNNFIPEKHTDFIFPVLAEEAGFLGVGLVLALYFILLWRILKVALDAKDVYGRMVAMGVFGLFLVHIFENIGMTLGVMPITGIPLPFFSHGGTSQLSNLIALGLVIHVSIERSKLEFSSFE